MPLWRLEIHLWCHFSLFDHLYYVVRNHMIVFVSLYMTYFCYSKNIMWFSCLLKVIHPCFVNGTCLWYEDPSFLECIACTLIWYNNLYQRGFFTEESTIRNPTLYIFYTNVNDIHVCQILVHIYLYLIGTTPANIINADWEHLLWEKVHHLSFSSSPWESN